MGLEIPKIQNIQTYTNGMKSSISDKLFWLNSIKTDIVIDFGCANGELLKAVHKERPNTILYGIDTNDTMLNLAKKNCSSAKNFSSFSEFADFYKKNNLNNKTTLLNLSSVLHELYSYKSSNEINSFWDAVKSCDFSYIAVRDMFSQQQWSKQASNPDEVIKLKELFPRQVADFEKHFGSIENKKNFLHFMLKYRYTQNWSREVKENYFAININEFASILPKEKYKIIYSRSFLIPYICNTAKRDTGIQLLDSTHAKFLFKHV